MLPEPSQALRLSINTEALTANWAALDRLSGSARAGAAVKANGYGLGAPQVTQTLRDAGCETFFVAHWSEAADLLKIVPPGAISVLHGPLTDADAAYAQATGVKPVINSVSQAKRWHDAGGGRCDLMVDTGINRLGLPLTDLGDPAIAALDIDVLLSHLASADEESPLNALQCERWKAARAQLQHRRASLANSAGIMLGPDYHGDLTRPGLALYGGVPSPELARMIRQVAQPQATIMQVRNIGAGDTVGYNATFRAERAMRVGTIAIGYADGYLRCWSEKGRVLAGDSVLPVLGRISMDMTVIDITDAPAVREGDWVDIAYSLPQAAAISGLSQYELLTLLGHRFGR